MLIKIVKSKGHKDRYVPLSEYILILLRNYFKEYKPEIYLFNGQKTLNYSSTSCNKLVKKYIDNKYTFHTIRHSCFTHMLESGIDIKIIKELAGHSNIKTTEIYLHLSNKFISKIKTNI
jgi:site-specific recombinase XerD